jgi:hypothetical protein
MKRKESPLKDKPMPNKEDGDISMKLEKLLGFRPFAIEW